MSHLDKEIKDEEKGEEEYEKLARKNPSESKKLRKIAKDERGHKKTLERLEKVEHSAKSKALKKKLK